MRATNSPPAALLKKCIAAVAAPALLASAFLFGESILSGGSQYALAKAKTCKEKRCEARCRGRYPENWKEITALQPHMRQAA